MSCNLRLERFAFELHTSLLAACLRGATFEFGRRPTQIPPRLPRSGRRGEEWGEGRRFWDQTSLLPGKLAGGETMRKPNANRSRLVGVYGTCRAFIVSSGMNTLSTRRMKKSRQRRRELHQRINFHKKIQNMLAFANPARYNREKCLGLVLTR